MDDIFQNIRLKTGEGSYGKISQRVNTGWLTSNCGYPKKKKKNLDKDS